MAFSHRGVKRLANPEDEYKHNEGIVTLHTLSSLNHVFTCAGVPAKHRNGESMMLRFRFDSLKLPHQQQDHVTNTGGFNNLSFVHDDAISREYPNSHPIGQDYYQSEYFRYIVEKALAHFKITNYEPFAVLVTCVIGATANTSALDQNFAAHLAAGSLKFGEDVGMATSRYLSESVDFSADANGIIAADAKLEWTADHLKQLQNAVSIVVPAAPVSSSGAYSKIGTTDEATPVVTTFSTPGMTDLKGTTRMLKVAVPVLKVISDVANGALTGTGDTGPGFSLEQHSGTYLTSTDGDGSDFSLPGPMGADGVAGTNPNPGGVYGTLIITPVDPLRRLDFLDITDTEQEDLCSSRVFVSMETWHTARLYDRVLNIPLTTIPSATGSAASGYLGLAGFIGGAEVAETPTTS